MGTYLITGAMGCIGAWAVHHLLERGDDVVSFDLSEDTARLRLLMDEGTLSKVTFVQGDLTDTGAVADVFTDHGITHVIHLAAMQVPMVRANPVLGSRVNVTGTVNVFEGALAAGVTHIAYASSIAVYGPQSDYPPGLVANDAPRRPRTLYGVFKVANEDTAKIYHQDHGVTSTALRPYTVYGLGRDQGLTSEPTVAMYNAARGEPSHMTFGGAMQFHFASDVARQFIEAADNRLGGAYAFNLGTPPVAVSDVAAMISEIAGVEVTAADRELPFPEGFDATELHNHFDNVYETPLREGVEATIAAFRESR